MGPSAAAEQLHTVNVHRLLFSLISCVLQCESEKKQDTTLARNFTKCYVTNFHNSFTDRISSKSVIKSYLHIPPHLKHVATLAT